MKELYWGQIVFSLQRQEDGKDVVNRPYVRLEEVLLVDHDSNMGQIFPKTTLSNKISIAIL